MGYRKDKVFVKIKNKGTSHRLFFKIIGLGTKQGRRDDKLITGQFHSGFKLAAPAVLRMGLEIIATSSDEIGPFMLEFSKATEILYTRCRVIVANRVNYHYSNNGNSDQENSGSSDIDFSAFPDWDSAIGDDKNRMYPILREYIANARDEDRSFTIEHGVREVLPADDGFQTAGGLRKLAAPDDGFTIVYLEETKAIRKILQKHPERYFKFLGDTSIFQDPEFGAIYKKSSPKQVRWFNDGYLVGCHDEDIFISSLFDYDLYGKDLVNEVRTIKDEYDFRQRLSSLVASITDKGILRQIIDFACANYMSIESKALGGITEDIISETTRTLAKEIWKEKFGERTVLTSNDKVYDNFAESALNYKVIQLSDSIKFFFKLVGIEDSRELATRYGGGLQYRQPSIAEQEKIQEALQYICRIPQLAEKMQELTLWTMFDPHKKRLGLTFKDWVSFALEEDLYTKEIEEFLKTFTHEIGHCISQQEDQTRDFRKQADVLIVYLLILIHELVQYLEKKGIEPSDITKRLLPKNQINLKKSDKKSQ